jgi:hypothetical protein
MIDTSKMTYAAFLRTLRMRYRSTEQPEITANEVRRLLDITSSLWIATDITAPEDLRRKRLALRA